MSIAYLVGFRLREGKRERFLDLLTAVMDAMRHEATYRAATLHADPDDPTHFLLHEIWADHDDVVNVQLHRPYRRAWHAALPELLREERRIEVWRPVEP